MTKDGRIPSQEDRCVRQQRRLRLHDHAICQLRQRVQDLYRDELGCGVDCWTVYTSSPTAGAMRGYGGLSPGRLVLRNASPTIWRDRIGMNPCSSV